MREITFIWAGEPLRLVPSMILLQRIASELRRVTDGAETTVSIAYQCINGGVEPMFLLIPLRAFIAEAKGQKDCPSDEEIMAHAMANVQDMVGFRVAYAQAILPQVTLGKGPAAPSGPGVGEKTAKSGSKKKSTSKPSTSSPG